MQNMMQKDSVRTQWRCSTMLGYCRENGNVALGLGHDVGLAFHTSLNIVQLFTAAAVVTVAQHCSSPNLPKTGCWAKILLAPPLAALNSNLKVPHQQNFIVF